MEGRQEAQPLNGEQLGWYKIALPGLAGNDLTEDEYAAGKRIFIENMPYVKSRREAMELAGDVMASLGRREDADSPYKTMEFYPDEWGKITRTPDGRYVDEQGNGVVQKMPFYPDKYGPQTTSTPGGQAGIKVADSILGEKYFGSSLDLAGKSAGDREVVNKSSRKFDVTAGNVVNLNTPAGNSGAVTGAGTGSTGGVAVSAGTAKPEETKNSNQYKELGDLDELYKELNIKPDENLQTVDAIVISGNVGIDLSKFGMPKIGISGETGVVIDLKTKKVYALNAVNGGLATGKVGYKSPLGGKITMLKIIPHMNSGIEMNSKEGINRRKEILTGASAGFDLYAGVGFSISSPIDAKYRGKVTILEMGLGTPSIGGSLSVVAPPPADKEGFIDALVKSGVDYQKAQDKADEIYGAG